MKASKNFPQLKTHTPKPTASKGPQRPPQDTKPDAFDKLLTHCVVSSHSIHRMMERGISPTEVEKTLRLGEVFWFVYMDEQRTLTKYVRKGLLVITSQRFAEKRPTFVTTVRLKPDLNYKQLCMNLLHREEDFMFTAQ